MKLQSMKCIQKSHLSKEPSSQKEARNDISKLFLTLDNTLLNQVIYLFAISLTIKG